MPKRTTSYRERLLQSLTVPAEAASYLNAALEDSSEMFLDALKDVASARQISRVAREAGVARESLYRSLSSDGNPTLDMLSSVLKALDLRIIIAKESSRVTILQKAGRRQHFTLRQKGRRKGVRKHGSQVAAFGQLSLFGNPLRSTGTVRSPIPKNVVGTEGVGAVPALSWPRHSRSVIAEESAALPEFNPQLAGAAGDLFIYAGQ